VTSDASAAYLFTGEGEVRAIARDLDWSRTSLGPVEAWSPTLRTVVRNCLESPFPINLWCGPELILIYNDAYRRILGSKHPRSFGRPGIKVWGEIWPDIAPMFEQIRAGGPPAYADDAPFTIERSRDGSASGDANAWFTFALSGVRDERGKVVAFLNIVSDSTGRVLAERAREAALARAEHAEARLLDIFAQAPAFMAVLRGPELVFEYANRAYYQLVGHRQLIGQPVLEALPELRGQGFDTLLSRVLDTGEPFVGREASVFLSRTEGQEPEQRFADFVYYPLTEPDGRRTGVVAHGYDVTDHVLARQDALRSRAEAEDASRAKSQFLANMSHEIRTPINAIIGYTDLLDLEVAGPLTADQRLHLERVRVSSQHLLGLVDDVLDLTRVEAGRLQVDAERTLVKTTVDEAISLVTPQAVRRQTRIENDCAGAELSFVADEDRVRQILVNLLSNAIKFTAQAGHVQITCGRSPMAGGEPGQVDEPPGAEMTWIAVQDDGIGIAPHEINRIFRPFTQLESGHTRRHGGSGLGLTISRHLARMMDGELTVESEPARGTRFTLWLPGEAAVAPQLDEIASDELAETRPPHLDAVARALLAHLPLLLDRFADRMRADARIPAAGRLGYADLVDHSASLLADLAQTLFLLESGRATPERLLQDGSEIQRIIAELHGRQRAALGWTGDAFYREWQILREEITTTLNAALTPSLDASGARRLLMRFVDRAERIGGRTLHHARAIAEDGT
jgi:PAS domain S-box-containing protein